MRPIHLRFSGLQSYREPQEVDFQRLTEVGLFGIFGPTGSGKSTILDAITLALYGRVERAGGGIQGIMNINSNQLSVSYAFALGERLFRAERNYRRNKAGEVELTGARLIEESEDQSIVLADRDVAGAVTELLGLKVQDFTRAVVLPQGKFAEFLTLTGAQRRSMLERLFGFSAYGKQLTERVRTCYNQSSNELEKVQAEQSALGDASSEALKAAEEEYQVASKEAKEAERELRKAQQAFEEAQQLRGQQAELVQIKKEQEEHQKRAPAMEKLAVELAQSEKAEPLRHLLTEANAAHEELEKAKQRAQKAEQKALQAKANFNQAQKAAETLERELKEEEPKLLQRRGELEGALKIEQQLSALSEEERDLAEQLSRIEGLLATGQTNLIASRNRRDALEREVAALREDRTKITIGAQEREHLGKTNAALQTLKQSQRELKTANEKYQKALADYREAKTLLAEAQKELAEVQQLYLKLEEKHSKHNQNAPSQAELVASGEALATMRNVVGTVRRLTCERAELLEQKLQTQKEQDEYIAEKTELERQLSAQKQALAELLAAKEEQEQAQLAFRLAETLVEGQPCPVCGSKDHPQLPKGQQLQNYTPKIANLEKEVTTLQTQLIRTETQQDALAKSLEAIGQSLVQLGAGIKEEREKLSPKWQQSQELERLLAEEEQAYLELKKQLELWQQEQTQLQQELNTAGGNLASLEKKEAALDATAEALNSSLTAAQRELGKSQQQLYRSRETFAALAGPLGQEEFEARLVEVQSWDRRLEQLERQERKLQQELSQIRAEVEKAVAKLEEAKLAKTAAVAQKKELDKKQGQLAQQLHSVTEGKAAAELLTKLEQVYSHLKEQAATSKSKQEEAQRQLAEAQGELERSKEALEGAQARSCRLVGELAESVEKAGFPSQKELASALRTEQQRQQLREELETYRKKAQRLEQEEERLKGLIAGKKLDHKNWQQHQQFYQAAQKRYQEAFTQRGAFGENLQQLKARHRRWQELETLQKDLVRKTDMLETLQSVLRGNVFVDFLAEEQLAAIAEDASARLSKLTGGHYSLEIGEDCSFEIIDHFSGNLRRPVNTLSGGETFLASLALALALSSQIQLQGRYQLEFFFLDEGFGTLDSELLETVMTALEQLQQEQMTIGVISHVPELRQRLARRLYVEPAEPLGRGSRVRLEVG